MHELDDMKPLIGAETPSGSAVILDDEDDEKEKAAKRSPLEDGFDVLEPELGSVPA